MSTISKTELTFTDEEIDRIAERIVNKLSTSSGEGMSYGVIAKYKRCTVYFECDEKANNIFVIKDENSNIVGKFIEENKEYKHRIFNLLESAAEEIENCYGKETELSQKIRYVVNREKEGSYDNKQKERGELYYALRTLKDNFKVAELIVSDTIKNEDGEETNTVKFDSVKSFAQYIKCFNDINIKYIEKKLGENAEE